VSYDDLSWSHGFDPEIETSSEIYVADDGDDVSSSGCYKNSEKLSISYSSFDYFYSCHLILLPELHKTMMARKREEQIFRYEEKLLRK